RPEVVVDGRLDGRRQGRAVTEQRGEPRLSAGALPQGQHPRHQPQKAGVAMQTEAQARRLLERALRLARAAKAEAIATLSGSRSGNTRFAVSEITSSADVERTQLSVTVQFGQRSATATTNQLDDRSIEDVVARAKRLAVLAPENAE